MFTHQFSNAFYCSFILDISTETLKNLAAPGKRSAIVISRLEHQASAIETMQEKIRQQLTRLQVEEQYLLNVLKSAPALEEDGLCSPSSPLASSTSMKIPQLVVPTPDFYSKSLKEINLDQLEGEESFEEEELPPSLQQARLWNHQKYDMNLDENYSEEEDEEATQEMRRIIGSQSGS